MKPKYHIFGHIHEANGIEETNGVTFINASTCNLRYKPENPIHVFDLLIKTHANSEAENGGEGDNEGLDA